MTNTDLPLEIEKRFFIDPHSIKSVCKRFNFVKSIRVIDQYLDTTEGFYYQKGVFIRVRNERSLDIKFNPDHLCKSAHETSGDHIVCHEYTMILPFDDKSAEIFSKINDYFPLQQPTPCTFEQFILENNFNPLVLLDKKRTLFEDDLCLIALDEFKELGTFIEFEAKNNACTMEAFLAHVKKLTQDCDLIPFNSGYVELALKKINKALYLKGKYLLHDDKHNSVAA